VPTDCFNRSIEAVWSAQASEGRSRSARSTL
jgi:hypothetical protein